MLAGSEYKVDLTAATDIVKQYVITECKRQGQPAVRKEILAELANIPRFFSRANDNKIQPAHLRLLASWAAMLCSNGSTALNEVIDQHMTKRPDREKDAEERQAVVEKTVERLQDLFTELASDYAEIKGSAKSFQTRLKSGLVNAASSSECGEVCMLASSILCASPGTPYCSFYEVAPSVQGMNALLRGYAAHVSSKDPAWLQVPALQWLPAWGGAVEEGTGAPHLAPLQEELPFGRKPAALDEHKLAEALPASYMDAVYAHTEEDAVHAAKMFLKMHKVSALVVPTPEDEFEVDAPAATDSAPATKLRLPKAGFLSHNSLIILHMLTDLVVWPNSLMPCRDHALQIVISAAP